MAERNHYAAGRDQFIGNTFGSTAIIGDNHGTINVQADEAERRRERLLESLKFPEMNARRNEIKDTEFHTFEWIFGSDACAAQEDHGGLDGGSTDRSYGGRGSDHVDAVDDLSEVKSIGDSHSGPDLEMPDNADDCLNIDTASGAHGLEDMLGETDPDSLNFDSEDAGDSDESASSAENLYRIRDEQARDRNLPSLAHWLKFGHEVYVVEGKAGSGKSTFMKFLFEYSATEKCLLQWSDGLPVTFLFHSFWLVGSKLQHNYRGLLASLAYQVISKHQDQPSSVVDRSPTKHVLNDWSTKDLQDFLLKTLRSWSQAVFLLLDGLDEFDQEDEIERLYKFIEELLKLNRIKICVSTRPVRHILDHFESNPGLRLQDLTSQDIWRYVYETLEKLVGPHRERSQITHLSDAILEGADGVFLWAYYVLRNVCRGIRSEDDLGTLIARISVLPSAIEDLYYQMWRKQNLDNAIHVDETSVIFNLSHHLPMPLFQLAILMNDTLRASRLEAAPLTMKEDQFEELCSDFSKTVSARSAGLIECVQDLYPPGWQSTDCVWGSNGPDSERRSMWRTMKVQYIHLTVHDFLTSTEQGIAISTHPQGTHREYQLGLIGSRLLCFVEDVLPFDSQYREYAIKLLRHVTSSSDHDVQLIDKICSNITSARLGPCRGNGVETWVLQLARSYNIHTRDPFGTDFPALLIMYSKSPRAVCSMLQAYGRSWSSYYKGYLLCAALQPTDYNRALAADLETTQILLESGADAFSPHIAHIAPSFIIKRSPAVQLLAYLVSFVLDGAFEFKCGVLLKLWQHVPFDPAFSQQELSFFRGLRGGNFDIDFMDRWDGLADYSDPVFVLKFDVIDVWSALKDVFELDGSIHDQASMRTKESPDTARHALRIKLGRIVKSVQCFQTTDPHGEMSSVRFELDTVRPTIMTGTDDDIRALMKVAKNLQHDTHSGEYTIPDAGDIEPIVPVVNIGLYMTPLDPCEIITKHNWRQRGLLKSYFSEFPPQDKTSAIEEPISASAVTNEDELNLLSDSSHEQSTQTLVSTSTISTVKTKKPPRPSRIPIRIRKAPS